MTNCMVLAGGIGKKPPGQPLHKPMPPGKNVLFNDFKHATSAKKNENTFYTKPFSTVLSHLRFPLTMGVIHQPGWLDFSLSIQSVSTFTLPLFLPECRGSGGTAWLGTFWPWRPVQPIESQVVFQFDGVHFYFSNVPQLLVGCVNEDTMAKYRLWARVLSNHRLDVSKWRLMTECMGQVLIRVAYQKIILSPDHDCEPFCILKLIWLVAVDHHYFWYPIKVDNIDLERRQDQMYFLEKYTFLYALIMDAVPQFMRHIFCYI